MALDDGIIVWWRGSTSSDVLMVLYIGHTGNLAERQREHREGRGGAYTAAPDSENAPVQLNSAVNRIFGFELEPVGCIPLGGLCD